MSIDSATLTPTVQNQIQTALGDWNTANANCQTNGSGNCSGVEFVNPPPSGSTADYFFFGTAVALQRPGQFGCNNQRDGRDSYFCEDMDLWERDFPNSSTNVYDAFTAG